jgi:hypothetical protein
MLHWRCHSMRRRTAQTGVAGPRTSGRQCSSRSLRGEGPSDSAWDLSQMQIMPWSSQQVDVFDYSGGHTSTGRSSAVTQSRRFAQLSLS